MRAILRFLMLLCFSAGALAATVEEDVQRYVNIFQGNASQHSDAADTFSWMGLSDPRIFDVIEQRLLADAKVAATDRHEKNRVARYIRALGFSGQAKYIPTINQFVTDNVYERYAKAALEDLPDYQRWNPIIANRTTFNPKLSDDTNRVLNMLHADDLLLKRVGAKRVFFKHQEPEVLELLAQELKANHTKADHNTADAVAWMVKALGQPRLAKYKPLIEEVAASAKESKVSKHADLVLQNYSQNGSR